MPHSHPRRLSTLIRRDSFITEHDHCVGVFTSGGDSQGQYEQQIISLKI